MNLEVKGSLGSKPKVIWIKAKGSALWYILHVPMLIKGYDTGRWAHFNVKLLC